MNYERYLEHEILRYIIATIGSPTSYLIFKDDKISFTKNISRATKTVSKSTARSIRDDFYKVTGRTDVDLSIVPVVISYELVKECEEEYELLS